MPQAPKPISDTARPERPSGRSRTLVVARQLAFRCVVAVQVGALLVAVPDDLAVPVGPGFVDRLAAADAVDAGAILERHPVAHQHRAVVLPDIVRGLDLDVVALERQLDELAVEAYRLVQEL